MTISINELIKKSFSVKKNSLRNQLTLSILVITLTTLLIVSVSYLVSNETKYDVNDFSKRSVPIFNAVADISDITGKLVYTRHKLINATNASSVLLYYDEIQADLSDKLAYLEDIKRRSSSRSIFTKIAIELQKHHGIISENASRLVLMKMQSFKIQDELSLAIKTSKNLQEKFNSNIAPIVDDVIFLSMLSLKNDDIDHIESRKISKQINVIVDTLELESQGNKLFSLLETIMQTKDIDKIAPLKERYTALSYKFSKRYNKYLETFESKTEFVPNLININDVEDTANKLINAKLEQLEIEDKLAEAALEMENTSRELIRDVNKLGKISNRGINISVKTIISTLSIGQFIIIIMGIFSIAFSAFIAWFYIQKNLINRMAGLRECMVKISNGELVDVNVSKHFDEIDDMAKAVEIFKNNMQENSNLNKALEDNIINLNDAKNVIENLVDGIITINQGGIISGFSSAATKIFGYREGEVIGKNVSMLMPDPFSSEHDHYLQRYKETGEKRILKSTREVIGLRKDGCEFPMELSVGEMEVGGKPVFIGSVRDITKQKTVADNLQHLAETKQAISDILRKMSLNYDTIEEMLNGFMDTLLSISWLSIQQQGGIFLVENDEEILTLVSSKYLSPKLRTLCNKVPFGHCLCGRAAMQKKSLHASCMDEKHEISFNGMKPHGHYNIPIMDGDNLMGLLVLYLENGTEENKEEISFLENVTELLSIAIKRKQAEQSFIIAKEAAEHSAKAKSEFLARMSHEIRTPMNGVIGTASLLEGTDINEKQKKYLHTIKSSGNSLLNILNEILDFSALEAGKIKVVSEPFNLYRCADEIYHLFQALVQEKGLEFKLEYDENLPEHIIGDQGRIRQTVINLLNNALKFTEEGNVTLKILSSKQKNGEQALKFSIYDTGDGISEDKLQYLFKTFSQVDESSVRKTGGTGLGLSICKALVEMMNGEIGVNSVEGEGAEFWFSIPLIFPTEEELIDYAAQGIQKEMLVEYTSYDASVLLVEDVEVNVFVITEMLESYGCRVDHAVNGKIALEMEAKKNYDIIFMDCQMPIMNGFQATKEIRKTNENIPIIALTANVLTEERDKCFDAGMDAFVSKPVTKKNFASVLSEWIPDLAIDDNDGSVKQEEAPDTEPSSESTNDEPVDFKALEQFGDNANKIIELTLKEADNFIEGIEKAVKEENTEDIGLEAHSLKSITAQIGAINLSEIAKELEMKGKSDDLNKVPDLFAALKSEYIIVKKILLKRTKNTT